MYQFQWKSGASTSVVLTTLKAIMQQSCLKGNEQYGLPLLELLVELVVISNKFECRVERFAQQQVQELRKSSLSNDRHGGIMRKKLKREMNKAKMETSNNSDYELGRQWNVKKDPKWLLMGKRQRKWKLKRSQ
ncbi:hypothetical protein Gotur_010386 [Gossypium turneri]